MNFQGNIMCCQVEISATGRSLVQRSPTECGVSEVWSRNLNNEASYTREGLLRQRGKKCNLVSEFNSSVTEFFFLSANVIYRLIRYGSGKVSDAANITKGMVPPDAAWLTISILQLF